MPKKNTRHAKDKGTTRRQQVDNIKKAENGVKHTGSLHVSVKNAKRWLSLKKRMGFLTDDDLTVHLLDLAEKVIKQNAPKSSKLNSKDLKKDIELKNPPKEVSKNEFELDEPLRRSPRKQLAQVVLEESPKIDLANSENTKNLENIQDDHGKHKTRTKHHRSKTKHHKEKKKKRKHSKNNESENLNKIEEENLEKRTNEIGRQDETNIDPSKLNDSSETQGILDEPVARRNDIMEHVSTSNINSKENICQNSQINENAIGKNFSIQEEISCKNIPSSTSLLKHVAEVSQPYVLLHQEEMEKFNLSTDSQILITPEKKSRNENRLTEVQDNHEFDEKKRKKRKHSKYDADSGQNESSMDLIDESGHKHRKKKHKNPEHKNKKVHDVRKAPQDGVIPIEPRDSSQKEFESLTGPPSVVQNDHDTEGVTADHQRLAIKIKLCQDCNNRHIQDSCPLVSTVYEITDALSHKEWVNKHKNNPDVTKIIETSDPMSEGYGKLPDDGFESDDDTEQYKSKSKSHSEEKRLQIDDERPLYARESIPDCLEFRMSLPDHGLGVFAKVCVPMYSKLGPLVGIHVKEMDIPDDFSMRHIWELENEGKTIYLSTTDPVKSNWTRYMRPADSREERNVALITKNGEIYFVTTQNISPDAELIYWSDSQSSAWTRKNKTDKTNCGGCNLNFTHSIYYRLHCCIFHDTNYSLTIRKYHCKVCGAAVLGKDNIMKHAAELHAGRGAYQCQYCRKFFLRLNYLEMHRTYGCSQNPQRSRPLCDFCGRKFCQPQKLKVHIKRMHSDMSEVLREFQCKMCMKLLGSRAALQRHMKEVHHKDVVGAATCDRCGKMFQNKSNLKIHMLTHSGVKPFKCKENSCKAAFTTKQCLQFHYKKVHGLSEDMMPKIERSVAYTFDAYSGGMIEDNGEGKSPEPSRRSSQDNCSSLMSLDDCSSDAGMKTDTQIPSFPSTNVEQEVENPMENTQQQETPDVESPRPEIVQEDMQIEENLSLRQEVDIYSPMRLQSKGSKKWMGEFIPAAPDVYDFEDSNKKDDDRSTPLPTASTLIDESKLAINVYRRNESTNASLLVEAALDAAERDIGAVSSPIMEDSERDGNIYSISNQLHSPLPPRSPENHLESYMQQQDDLMSPAPTSDNRTTPPSHMHPDYHLHRTVDYINTPRTHNIEQYLHHEDLPRGSSPTNYIHMPQEDLESPSATPDPRYQDLHHHHHHHHQQGPSENLSSDEGDSVAQNLSISVKEKSLQIDIPTSYKYDQLDLDFGNRERNFEPIVLNNGELQGLDMSARSFHNFGSQLQNSRYHHHHHHHLYEISERQSVDLSRTGAYSISPPPPYPHSDVLRVVSLDLTPGGRHSVDLSLSRSHHLHGGGSRMMTSPQSPNSSTPHIVGENIDNRMLSPPPPPPPLPAYNPAYPVSPAPYHPPRPSYHHYSGYY